MKVLVLGAGGMAGHVIALHLRDSGLEVDTLSATKPLDAKTHLIDVSNQVVFKKFLDTNHYDVVINCIGVLVKQSEEQKALAVYLNSYLPRLLETYYAQTNTKVVHISSDGVFSGKNSPYIEGALYDSESFYGRSKALGEINNDKDISFRLSIIGPDISEHGTSLFNWFYKQKGEISGYTNILWNGITTIELAKAIKAALEQNISGLYHLCAAESISKFNLLQLLKDVFGRDDITILPTKGSGSGSTLVNTRQDFSYVIPDYETMVNDMKKWIENHPKVYRYYGE